MEDRTPTPGQEGRMLITPEDGSAPFYAKLTMADNPTSPGTPLNKNTLLRDGTEISLFGSAENRTVDEAFQGIGVQIALIKGDQASITLTVQDQAGNPVPGLLINNVVDADGKAVYTNDSGIANGYVAEGHATISVSGYADVADYSETFQVIKGESYIKVWTVTTRDFFKVVSTQNLKFSENVEQVDVSVGGAGGGAGGYLYGDYVAQSGGGGGGGYVATQTAVTFSPNIAYPAIIGAGGRGSSMGNGSAGGSSSFLGVTADGGNGGFGALEGGSAGTGNGNGANGVSNAIGGNGGVGTQSIYISFAETGPYGGGGGSGGAMNSEGSTVIQGGSGGAPGGGNGGSADADYNLAKGVSGLPNTGGGGGSGAIAVRREGGVFRSGQPGIGGSGCVAIRMHLKTAA